MTWPRNLNSIKKAHHFEVTATFKGLNSLTKQQYRCPSWLLMLMEENINITIIKGYFFMDLRALLFRAVFGASKGGTSPIWS